VLPADEVLSLSRLLASRPGLQEAAQPDELLLPGTR
jgi:hypothetical protein